MTGKTILKTAGTICTDASSQDIKTDTLPTKQKIRWTRVSASDRTSNPTRVELYFLRGGMEFLVRAGAQGALGRTVTIGTDVVLTGDYQIMARFIGATLGDDLTLTALGYLEPTE